MSLTSELDRLNSPMRRFMEGNFPVVSSICEEIAARCKVARTLRPLASNERPPWGQIGMAIGYRLGFAMGNQDLHLATIGARRAGRYHEKLMERAAKEIEAFGGTTSVGRLNAADEDRFARLCWAAALYETLFRAGPDINTPLWTLRSNSKLDDLLSLASPLWIADMAAMTTAAWGNLVEPFADVPLADRHPGTTFDGSAYVGGADCDLLVGTCLFEIKTTVQPRPDRVWPYQLAGYALLDYSDEWHISEVAFYLPRQALLFRWPLEGFLRRMTEFDRSHGLSRPAVDVASVRAKLQARLDQPLQERPWLPV